MAASTRTRRRGRRGTDVYLVPATLYVLVGTRPISSSPDVWGAQPARPSLIPRWGGRHCGADRPATAPVDERELREPRTKNPSHHEPRELVRGYSSTQRPSRSPFTAAPERAGARAGRGSNHLHAHLRRERNLISIVSSDESGPHPIIDSGSFGCDVLVPALT